MRSSRDALDGESTDEDTPVRSARTGKAPEDAAPPPVAAPGSGGGSGGSAASSAKGRPAGVGLLSLPFKLPSRGSSADVKSGGGAAGGGGGGGGGGAAAAGGEDGGAEAPRGLSGGLTGDGSELTGGGGLLSSRSRGGPKPLGLGGLSFGGGAKKGASPQRRESLQLLNNSDDDDEENEGEGQEINLSGSDDGEEGGDNDFFDEDADLNASANKKDGKYSTGTFSDSGTFQLQGSHEINE